MSVSFSALHERGAFHPQPLRLLTQLHWRALNLTPFTLLVKKDTIKHSRRKAARTSSVRPCLMCPKSCWHWSLKRTFLNRFPSAPITIGDLRSMIWSAANSKLFIDFIKELIDFPKPIQSFYYMQSKDKIPRAIKTMGPKTTTVDLLIDSFTESSLTQHTIPTNLCDP